MRTVTIKNSILTIAQLLVTLAMFVVAGCGLLVAYMDLLLRRCLNRLTNPLSTSLQKITVNPPVPPVLTEHARGKGLSLKALMELLNHRSDRGLVIDRQVFENTDAGRRAVRTNPDRRIYAVARPTRAENLKRIQNVFCEMDCETLQKVFKNASAMVGK